MRCQCEEISTNRDREMVKHLSVCAGAEGLQTQMEQHFKGREEPVLGREWQLVQRNLVLLLYGILAGGE